MVTIIRTRNFTFTKLFIDFRYMFMQKLIKTSNDQSKYISYKLIV